MKYISTISVYFQNILKLALSQVVLSSEILWDLLHILLTPLLIIHCAVYFEFDNDYEKTFENSQLLSSKIIQILLLLNFVFLWNLTAKDVEETSLYRKLFFVHNCLSLVIFYEMSKFFQSNSQPLFLIVSILFFI